MIQVDIGGWDLALIAAVSAHATVMAYVHHPRFKALVYGLPVPFSLATLALGRPVGVTHVLGIPLMCLFIHGVRWLTDRARVPVVASIVGCAAGYCLVAAWMAPKVPDNDASFWLCLCLVLLLGLCLYFRVPHREQPGHRSPLPVPLKFVIIGLVITGLVLIKEALQGFMTSFPMVGVVGTYEARHSLWTLSRQVSVLIIALTALLAVCRVTQERVGLLPSLLLGWVAFLVVLVPMTSRMWRRTA